MTSGAVKQFWKALNVEKLEFILKIVEEFVAEMLRSERRKSL